MTKIPVQEMTYETAVIEKGYKEYVGNLQYPVKQEELDELCARLPYFYNNMGELFLVEKQYRK